MPGTPPRRSLTRRLLIGLCLAASVEAGSFAGTAFLARRGAMAYIPSFAPTAIAGYLRERDPELGWGRALNGAGRREAIAQPDPAFAESPRACVSVYGDSFTAGSGVRDDETFAHDLAVTLACRVANYGVGAFGSDQALMLARLNGGDAAPVTMLAHLSENILRNVNQYRNLLISGSEFAFKPRYVLDGGTLRYLPIPVKTPDDFERLHADPSRVLTEDRFLARPRRSFPYTWSLAAYFLRDPHVRATVTRTPWYVPFYSPDHPSGALALTARILEAFVRDATAHQQTAMIVLVPASADFAYAARTGAWPDQPLADLLTSRGVPLIHLGPALRQRLGAGNVCELFQECTGHLTPFGHRLVAERLASAIRTR